MSELSCTWYLFLRGGLQPTSTRGMSIHPSCTRPLQCGSRLASTILQIHCLDAEGTIHFDCMVQSVVAGVLEKVHCQELCDCLRTCWRLLIHINPFSWHIVESWNKIERNPGGLFANVPQKGWIYHSRISDGCLVNFYFVIFCWTFVLRHVIPSESIGQMQLPFVRPNLLHNLSAATFGGTQRP